MLPNSLLKDLVQVSRVCLEVAHTELQVAHGPQPEANKLLTLGFTALEILIRLQQATLFAPLELSSEDQSRLLAYCAEKLKLAFYENLEQQLNAFTAKTKISAVEFGQRVTAALQPYIPDVALHPVNRAGVEQFELSCAEITNAQESGHVQDPRGMFIEPLGLGDIFAVLESCQRREVTMQQLRGDLLKHAEKAIADLCPAIRSNREVTAELSAKIIPQQTKVVLSQNFLVTELTARVQRFAELRAQGAVFESVAHHRQLVSVLPGDGPLASGLQHPLLPEADVVPLMLTLLQGLSEHKTWLQSYFPHNDFCDRVWRQADTDNTSLQTDAVRLVDTVRNNLLSLSEQRHLPRSRMARGYELFVETLGTTSQLLLTIFSRLDSEMQSKLQGIVNYLLIYGLSEIPHARCGSMAAFLSTLGENGKLELLYQNPEVRKAAKTFIDDRVVHYYYHESVKTRMPDHYEATDYFPLLLEAARLGDTKTLLRYLIPRRIRDVQEEIASCQTKLRNLLLPMIEVRLKMSLWYALCNFLTTKKDQGAVWSPVEVQQMPQTLAAIQAKEQGAAVVDIFFWFKQRYPWLPLELGDKFCEYTRVHLSATHTAEEARNKDHIYCVRDSQAGVSCFIWRESVGRWLNFSFARRELPAILQTAGEGEFCALECIEHVRTLCGFPSPQNIRDLVDYVQQKWIPPEYLYQFYLRDVYAMRRRGSFVEPEPSVAMQTMIDIVNEQLKIYKGRVKELAIKVQDLLGTLQKNYTDVSHASFVRRNKIINDVVAGVGAEFHLDPNTLTVTFARTDLFKTHPEYADLQVLMAADHPADRYGNTLLHEAALHRRTNAVVMLMDLGLSLATRNKLGQTVMEYADFSTRPTYADEIHHALQGSALQQRCEHFLREYLRIHERWEVLAGFPVVRSVMEWFKFHTQSHREDRKDKTDQLLQGCGRARDWYDDEALIVVMNKILEDGFNKTKGLLGHSRLETFITTVMVAVEQQKVAIFKPIGQRIYRLTSPHHSELVCKQYVQEVHRVGTQREKEAGSITLSVAYSVNADEAAQIEMAELCSKYAAEKALREREQSEHVTEKITWERQRAELENKVAEQGLTSQRQFEQLLAMLQERSTVPPLPLASSAVVVEFVGH